MKYFLFLCLSTCLSIGLFSANTEICCGSDKEDISAELIDFYQEFAGVLSHSQDSEIFFAFSPDKNVVYAANSLSSSISVISQRGSHFDVINEISLDFFPISVEIDSNGEKVIVKGPAEYEIKIDMTTLE